MNIFSITSIASALAAVFGDVFVHEVITMQILVSQAHRSARFHNAAQERYGPYLVFPQFRRTLEFGGIRSFELLIAAFCDPRVVPQHKAVRRRLNGIAVVWHGPRNEVIILEGLESVERTNLKLPTRGQVAAFRQMAEMPWTEFSTFVRSSPAACPSWRQTLPWCQLEEVDSDAISAAPAQSDAEIVAT